jgi:RNA polymerase sigma-70 factor (ECF subfamily)
MNSRKGDPLAVGDATMPYTASRESLSQLFCEHHRRILTAAYRITGSMADAEDVTQAVFVRLVSGGGLPMANAGSYLYRAAINGALDLLRRRKAAPAGPLEEAAELAAVGPASSPETAVSNTQLGNWLRLAISELPPRAAEVFSLRYVEELGNREIATLMGTSQAVVAVTLHHARAKLKKRLREMQQERP